MADESTLRDHLADMQLEMLDLREQLRDARQRLLDPRTEFAGRYLSFSELIGVIEVMHRWLQYLDNEQEFSAPNGHIWNAIDTMKIERKHG